jgi:hypothetical protein
MDNYIEA